MGIHHGVEVTDAPDLPRPSVSQVFCSALPVRYSDIEPGQWTAFATLVLEAAYEATLLATVLSARRGGSNRVFLTRLGGGAFGNDAEWIDLALRRALRNAPRHALDEELDVWIVSFGAPSESTLRLLEDFSALP